MTNSGVLLLHQGHTDIINILGLITYYSTKYYKLYIFIKQNEKLLKFYCKNLNIEIIVFAEKYDRVIYSHVMQNHSSIMNNSDYLFHGFHDVHRKDIYNSVYQKIWNNNQEHFVNLFYYCYNIPVSVRIDSFIFERDHELENKTYDNFVQEHGDKYILYHFNDNKKNEYKKDYEYINLNQSTETFFDYIKILENSKEFHLLDSSWGAFIYLLDCKYRLFKDKTIYLYPLRNHIKMFQDPVKLDNWVFV